MDFILRTYTRYCIQEINDAGVFFKLELKYYCFDISQTKIIVYLSCGKMVTKKVSKRFEYIEQNVEIYLKMKRFFFFAPSEFKMLLLQNEEI